MILFFKASKIPDGARWITIHPNGPDEKGQPILIQPNPDGSAHVIGGAGGSLNYLKLRKVRSESDYKKEAEEKRAQKAAEKKEQTKRDKEAGIHESKKQAKQNVRVQRLNHESKFVQTVADAMGWDKQSLEFPEEQYKNVSEAAANKARERFHRDLLQHARDAVQGVRQQILKDADARLTADIGAVPVTATSNDVISVQDLDPVPTNTTGLGFSTKYRERAEQQGLTPEAAKEERAAIQPKQSDAQREATIKRGKLGAAIKEELNSIRDPAKPPKDGQVDLKKVVPLLKAEKLLKQIHKKSRDAMAAIDESTVEPKAYVIAADADDAAVDKSVEEDLSNDLRTIKTRAFLSQFKEIGGGDSLGKYLGIGAYNSVNALALAVSGDALVDRSVVDVLGIAGAAQVLARRIHADLPEAQATRVAESMQDFHLNQYMETSTKAMDRARDLMEQAKAIEVTDLSSATDIKAAQELNHRHAEAIKSARTTIGEALGEMEANAALTLALKQKSNKPFQVSLGETSLEAAIQQVRALGLQRGEYSLERTAGNVFLTVNPEGMNRLAKPINKADIEQVRRNLGIIQGDQDEEDWLPGGFARRPDLVMDVKPGVAPRLAQPFAPGANLEQSIRDYIGGRAADGDNPADILADLQSADFVRKSGDPAKYQAALDAVAPIHGADGGMLRAEDMAPAFDKMADEFVDRKYKGERTTLNRQKFDVDQKAADALHRALAKHPAGVAAYKEIGEIDSSDARALRTFFHREIAKESPETAALRDEFENHVKQEPERHIEDMFGEQSENPEWRHWNSRKEEMTGKLNSGSLTWAKYVEGHRSPEKAYESIQDLIRSRVNSEFAETYNKLNPDKPLKVGRATIRNNLTHLDMTEPVAREKRLAADRARIDALRERSAGRYAAGSVADKLDAARAQEDAFNQSQMGFFSSEDVPETTEKPLGGDERHSLGHIAERQIAGMMGKYGHGFSPDKPTQVFHPTMSGGKNYPRQRMIKMLEQNKRAVAAFGTGSGKTAIQLGSFTHLHSKGKAKRGLFLVPSVVQNEFAAHATQLLEPGKFNWHIKAGASQAERIAAYKDPKHHFMAMTHGAFRQDMIHLGAAAAGVSESDMTDRLNAMAPDARKAWMKDLMAKEGINFDYLSVDEGQTTLNREGKENSAMANVVDALSANTPYYLSASADTVKNDTSEIYDIFSKMDPERYKDRDAFMRRYGADTIGSKDALRREMARYIYPSKIDPDVKVDRNQRHIELSEGQKLSLAELDKNMASMQLAHMQGNADVKAARAVSPAAFEGAPETEHERIAKDLQRNTGILKSSAIQRLIYTHPDNPIVDDAVNYANERKGKAGVVFAHSLQAVKMIAERMEKAGHKVVVVTGSDTAEQKDAKRRQFQGGEADILVASDAASTGMNATRGHWVYQYDTPMVAMTHAQREGRIKRNNQTHDIELSDAIPNHPEIRKARDRLAKKYALRELMTTPLEALDESGIAYYLKQKQVYENEQRPSP